jgi:hypothetical protein
MTKALEFWDTHLWVSRTVEIEHGCPLIQQICRSCGRNFVDEIHSGERYAVHVAVFKFDRLADEVTARWLCEPCPRARMRSDEIDERTRFSFMSLLDEAIASIPAVHNHN